MSGTKQLQLTVLGFHNQIPELAQPFIIDGHATLGRNNKNSIVLPDPTRIVSGTHCIIDRKSETQFLVKDVSSNGLFINDDFMPLGNTQDHILKPGDILTLGDYKIEIQLLEEHLTEKIESRAKAPEDVPSVQPSPPAPDYPVDDFEYRETANEETRSIPRVENVAHKSDDSLNHLIGDWNALNVDSFRDGTNPEPKNLPASALSVDLSPSQSAQRDEKTLEIPAHDSQLIATFLEAAGLDKALLRERDETMLLELGGRLLRESISGLLKSIQIRSSIKSEMGMNKTQVVPAENNPIKYSVNVDDAMERLFRVQKKGYLTPETSVAEAFKDIQRDQFWATTCYQTLTEVLTSLNPTSIQKNNSDDSRLSALFKYKNLWGNYIKTYEAALMFSNNLGKHPSREGANPPQASLS